MAVGGQAGRQDRQPTTEIPISSSDRLGQVREGEDLGDRRTISHPTEVHAFTFNQLIY